MKKIFAFFCSAVFAFAITGVASADYTTTDLEYVYEGAFNGPSGGGFPPEWEEYFDEDTIEWTHSLPCCDEGFFVSDVELTIRADDVDGPGYFNDGTSHDGEFDWVTVNDGVNFVTLGTLTQLEFYNAGRPGFWPGEDPHPKYEYALINWTTFDSEQFPELLFLDYSGIINVSVAVDGSGSGWGLEVETSELKITCSAVPVPPTLLLLGSGVMALVGLRKHGKSRVLRFRF